MVKLELLHFPINYVQIFQEIGRIEGTDTLSFLSQELGIDSTQIDDSNSVINGLQLLALLQKLKAFISSDPTRQHTLIDLFPPTIHGNVAFAAITASNIKQALDVAVRFSQQVMPAFDVHYDIVNSKCTVTFTRLTSFDDCNDLMTEMMFCALHSVACALNNNLPPLNVIFTHNNLVLSELPNRYPNLSFIMNGSENSMSFSQAHLQDLIPTRNTATHQAITQTLKGNEKKIKYKLTYQVSCEIVSLIERKETVEAKKIIHKLGMSERTMSRRLAEEGTSFRTIHNDCRFAIAKEFLLQRKMAISEISDRLGFSDEANFSRFFKRQSGINPTQFRSKNTHS